MKKLITINKQGIIFRGVAAKVAKVVEKIVTPLPIFMLILSMVHAIKGNINLAIFALCTVILWRMEFKK